MKSIYIKICDEGWIIEQLASRLTRELDDVAYGLDDRSGATLCYHLPYLTYARRTAPRVAGFFTHIEADEERRAKFWAAARDFDHCTCQSLRYAEAMVQKGVSAVSVISPGVDLDFFRPEVRIGVVGRTYDSGRKGEAIIAQLLDLPGIRWSFTGRGWPGGGRMIDVSGMPAFYNDQDYILISSLYEGGPMCMLEALACGKEVIAPPIGWVEEFPHIEYPTGDVEALRRILLGLVAKRQALREHVMTRTWRAWVDEHDLLFQALLRA
ncbi:glycosyltransferase family 4 protein [Paludisphaera rhizosphaerae]|uniref:glycosyltransferase family 4 protein n=1 Tax=Paludisphaera rhizosphaerae TaxID=2711216 RepID=UPI0013EB08AA|nr:glycosyltransferase family 4 protein [Paludisphaera rhizosphaerae]